jgi:hypothetical protein
MLHIVLLHMSGFALFLGSRQKKKKKETYPASIAIRRVGSIHDGLHGRVGGTLTPAIGSCVAGTCVVDVTTV